MVLNTDNERPLRILLVDDNQLDRAEAKAALLAGSDRRYDFTEAASTAEALQFYGQVPPFDCMVLDFFLQDGDALDVLAQLPCDADNVPQLPVVILTGVSGASARASLRHGAQDFVGKAWLGPESLTWAVENAIERRMMAREVMAERAALEAQRLSLLEAERVARLESERVMQLKDEFLATLSHELRTPLAAIVGWATVLQHAQGNPATVQRGIEAIVRNGGLQARLIDDLLDMNRIVTGKLVLDLHRIDMGALLMAASDILRPMATTKGVGLTVEGHDGLALHVHGDALRLQQVFANLLSNALKFTPSGGKIKMTMQLVDDAQLAVTVSDTGEGIDTPFIAHLFDRFSQANSKAARVHGGLGIGLSIVKQLTELHGGTVSGASAGLGAGASFTVLLPLAPDEDDGEAPVAFVGLVEEIAAIDLRGIHVLLVDDNADILELSRRVLAECGASVVTVDSARAALFQLRGVRPHVLISDISMPELNGYDLIRAVRNDLKLDAQALPAIAMSAYARTPDQHRALEAGYQAYLVKPLQPHLLIRAVAQLSGVTA